MRQLPLYLRLQQLLDGELPEEQYREMNDLEREFQQLDEIDNQKDDASDEDLELDEMEEDLMAASVDEDTDLGSLIDRKSELEAQLFGDEDAPWNDSGDEIRPLRELIDTIAGSAGGRSLGGLARPRLERLLKAVDELDPDKPDNQRVSKRRRPSPGSRNLVASRRRRLLAEFRATWKEALDHAPPPAGESSVKATGVQSPGAQELAALPSDPPDAKAAKPKSSNTSTKK